MNTMTYVIYFAVIIAVFYFFMIRPERKRKKQLTDMRNTLSIGQKITTIGGIVGKVVAIDDEHLTFETSEDRVRIEVARWAVSTVDGGQAKVQEAEKKEDKTEKKGFFKK